MMLGDIEVQRTSFRLYPRWSWIKLVRADDEVTEFEGGWAATKWGARRQARKAPNE